MNIWHVTKEEIAEGCSSVTGACNLVGADRHYTSKEAAIAASFTLEKPADEIIELSTLQKRDLNHFKNNLKGMSQPEVYFHPQGKLIIANKGSNKLKAYKNGVSIGTTATIEKLKAGHGAWKKLAEKELDEYLISS